MRGLFDPAGRECILERLGRLEPGAARRQGNHKQIDRQPRPFGA
jgi:hypothetical protein